MERKLLGIPNDSIKDYRNVLKEDFLGEFNPLYFGRRFFDKVSFLNWIDEIDSIYLGVFSKSFLKDKEKARKLYDDLVHFKFPFDSKEGSFRRIFEEERDEIRKYVQKFRPNLIRAFNTHFATELGLLVREFIDAPLVASAHDPTRLTSAVSKVDSLVCESYELEELCIEEFDVNPSKIRVIPNGINMNFFYPRSEGEIEKVVPREFLEAPYKVLSSSRLVRGKNIETLVSAMDIVRRKLPGVIHLHLGSLTSQYEKTKEIKGLLKELNLEKTSYFLGHIQKKDIPLFYSWADVFSLPTLWEGLSRVIREALACGTTVVTTNYGSSAEIVKSGYNGIGIDPTNKEELAEAIIDVLSNDILRKKLEKNSRKSVYKKYSLKRSMELYSELYGSLINRQP